MSDQPVEYVRRVIVKFEDQEQFPYDDDNEVEIFFDTGQAGPWLQLKEQFNKLIKIKRLFTSVSPQRIRQLSKSVSNQHPHTHRSNLLTYFAITCPTGVDRKELAAALRNKDMWPKVQTAYVQGGPGPSPGVTLGPKEAVQQGYLDPAPTAPNVAGGINAKHAWAITGGDGGGSASLQFVDIEQGWFLNHEDLPSSIQLIFGNNRQEQGHGACALGIVTAVPGNSVETSAAVEKRCAGITPHVMTKLVASSWEYQSGGWIYSVANAILAAFSKLKTPNILKAGDVILVEAQTDNDCPLGELLPVEVELAEYDVIKNATDADIVVIEAAGNSTTQWNNDLDSVHAPGDGYILRRTGRDPYAIRDSGAIIVAAGYNDTRGPIHNFGQSCVDCYAWGDNVYTTGFSDSPPPPPDPTKSYIGWTGTSSAAAIVAGAALALQGIKKANTGIPYTSRELRKILSDWHNGTVSENSAENAANYNNDKIGIMPDLKKITVNENLIPDIYIRDNALDNGLPHLGSVSSSPDIILRDVQFNPLPNLDRQAAQAFYEEGTGRENDYGLSMVVPGKDAYIYMRVKNRGNAGAENVEARVYWSKVATLLDPNLWHRVDPVADDKIPSVVIPQVPKGDRLILSSSITWLGANIPASGHYCFVALVGNEADRAPDRNAFLNWNSFLGFIRDNNNITWRNFNVVEVNSTGSSGIQLKFDMAGAWDAARAMRFEVGAEFPDETRIYLEAPIKEEEVLKGFAILGPVERDTRKQVVRGELHFKEGRSQGREVQLRKGFRAENCQLQINIPQGLRHKHCEIYIRQLFKNVEVGRITWRLRPKK